MNASINQARECLLDQVLGATTLAEIAAAKQALRDWLQIHPEEGGMREGFEQLYLLEEIALEQQAEKQAHQVVGAN